MRIWKAFGRLLGWLGNIQAVYALIPASLLSAVSGISGYLTNGLGWALFMASGVFVFVALGITLMRESYRANRLEHKITVTAVNVQQYANILLFRPSFTLVNNASFELFFEVVTADYVFGSSKGGLDTTVPLRGLLSAHEGTSILIPAASGTLPFNGGRILIGVNYGREKDRYEYSLTTTLQCATLTVFPQESDGDMPTSRLVQSLEYAPIKPYAPIWA